jgi:hypothetical protein
MNRVCRTIEQKPLSDNFAKARELIEIRGTGELSLHDRRIMNILYANAGSEICDDKAHVISFLELRGSHKGGERITDSIRKLQKTLVFVPSFDRKGNYATRSVPILSETTITDDESNPDGMVVYSFSQGMRDIIRDSTLWGRIRSGVIFAFSSKYSLALYELVCARVNMEHVWWEEFSVGDLRALLGVPDGKLTAIPNLLQRVIEPAVLEVNSLAEFVVRVDTMRKGGKERGLVTKFCVSWHKKNEDQIKAAYQEMNRSKIGRIARLRDEEKKTPKIDYAAVLEGRCSEPVYVSKTEPASRKQKRTKTPHAASHFLAS